MASKQVFIITGCSTGFGFHLAEHFLSAGQHVVVTARDASKISEFERRYPQTALTLELDVTDRASISKAVSKTIEKFGRIDVLINNAGYAVFGPAETLRDNEVRGVFETNFFGAVFMSQEVLPIMRKQGSGTIVQVSSAMGVTTYPAASIYCASKFALEGFSDGLAKEVAEHGIRVIIAEPGGYNTSFGDKVNSGARLDFEGYNIVKQTFALMQVIRGNEPGDPKKFAVALEKVLALEKPPLRIPLGSDSAHMIKTHITQQLSDLEKYKDISSSTDLDPMPEATVAIMKGILA